MQRKDIFISVVIGIITGAIWAGIFIYLNFLNGWGGAYALFLIIPATVILFISGLYIGRLLSYWRRSFLSFSRYAMVGFLNTGIDFGIFNLFMFMTGTTTGTAVTFFKVASFAFATVNSYFWNKLWVFKAGAGGDKKEFIGFIAVSTVGIGLNAGVATLIFSLTPSGFDQVVWNNIAAAIATITNLVWNFVGYKLLVFKGETKEFAVEVR